MVKNAEKVDEYDEYDDEYEKVLYYPQRKNRTL